MARMKPSRAKLSASLLALAVFAFGLVPNAALSEFGPAGRDTSFVPAENPVQARVIVKYKSDSVLMRSLTASSGIGTRPLHAATLSQRLRLPLSDGRSLGSRTQGLRGTGLSSSQLAQQLATLPDVEWAVPDQRRRISAVPNDPLLADNQLVATPVAGQWYLRAPSSTIVSAINAVGAWDLTTGSSNVTVAVLDTGVLSAHPDLAGKLHPGYDFVHDIDTAKDGDGRDANPEDPGDATTLGECSPGEAAASSSWHGTQVAGLIGAATNNGFGMAGVGYNVMVLPVRVLGRCGGFDSDIIAAMRWAAGVSNDVGFNLSVTVANTHPAKVINLSLGSSGACPASYRDVVAEVNAAGVSVVAAVGNGNGTAVDAPANCPGVIAVAGVRHVGSKVGYSSVGPEVAIAAPAGNCVNANGSCLYPLITTFNDGLIAPANNTFSNGLSHPSFGTSFSAPLVAGTVGLMLSRNPALTPLGVRAVLQSSARTFPTTGGEATAPVCHAPNGVSQIECYCTTSTCGAGMLSTSGAVARAFDPTVAIALPGTTVTAGTTVTLDGSGTVTYAGRRITSYQWSITEGTTIASLSAATQTGTSPTGETPTHVRSNASAGMKTILAAANFSGATNGPTVTLVATSAGTVRVQLAVTDDGGASATSNTSITIAAAPVAVSGGGGGGGGALDLVWLLGLGSALVMLLVSRKRAKR